MSEDTVEVEESKPVDAVSTPEQVAEEPVTDAEEKRKQGIN